MYVRHSVSYALSLRAASPDAVNEEDRIVRGLDSVRLAIAYHTLLGPTCASLPAFNIDPARMGPVAEARRPAEGHSPVWGDDQRRPRRGSLRVPESPYLAVPVPSDRCANRSPPGGGSLPRLNPPSAWDRIHAFAARPPDRAAGMKGNHHGIPLGQRELWPGRPVCHAVALRGLSLCDPSRGQFTSCFSS